MSDYKGDRKGGRKRNFGNHPKSTSKERYASPKQKFSPQNKRKGKFVKKETSNDGSIRLNKYIANAGICSRREADDLIIAGAIKINDKVVTELGTKVQPNDIVHYGGELISKEKKQYFLLNKPKGYITTMDDPFKRKTVMELIGKACKERIYPVGRLDRATSGLLLFTNDGHLTKRLTHPSSNVRKVYQVKLDQNVTQNHLLELVEGIELEDGRSHADKAYYNLSSNDKSEIVLELHSGKNRIIRRMMESLGYKVVKLDRIQFAGLTKKNLIRGRYRQLSDKEVGLLHRVAGLSSRQ